MKILILTAGLFLSVTTHATNLGWQTLSKKILQEHAEECKVAKIEMEEIVKNSHIKGHVTGLKETSFENFKMLFYVKTNNWYVHPYLYNQSQPSGYSYSDLATGGEFWIRSVFRTPSKEMAVILVPAPHLIYAKKSRLNDLLKFSCTHVIVPGNGDFSP